MPYLKKCCSLPANSILESVVALSIISICLFIAIMVVSSVFSKKTDVRFYRNQNRMNEMFYLAQINTDSLLYENEDENLTVEEEAIGDGMKKIDITLKDSTNLILKKTFYLPAE